MATSSSPEGSTKIVKINRFQIGLNVLLQILIFLGIVVMLNYVSFRHFKRWDFSRDKKYELSSQTRSLLGNLKKPVKAFVFFSTAAEISPDVGTLLKEFEYASDGKFKAEIVDPYRNLTRATELSTKYKFGSSENILILDYDGKNKFVNAADMAEFEMPDQISMMAGQTQPKLKAFKGEQAVTSALLELTEGKTSKIYFVGGHGEPELNAPDLKVFNESMKRQNIKVEPLKILDVNAIPDDARALVIDGPKYDFSELEMKLLSDFWAKKGRVFILLNPYAKTPLLNGWIEAQGIVPQDDRIIKTGTFLQRDDEGKPQLVSGVINDPTFVVADTNTKITQDIGGLSKQFVGATQSLMTNPQLQAMAKTKVLPVILSGKDFWGETEMAGDEKKVFFDPKKDHMGPLTMAAAVEKGGVDDQRVKVESARMFVVGNAQLLNDNAYRLSGGISNDILVNVTNWLLDREEVMGIPPKEKKSVVLSLDEKQLDRLALAVMVGLPAIIAFFGLLVWTQRRA